MATRFNPPPNWPPPPDGFVPGPGWRPDPSWPPPPAGWLLWVSDDQAGDAAASGLTPGYIGYGPSPSAPSPGPGQPAAGSSSFPQQTTPVWRPPAVPPRPGTSGMAVAAFVLGLLGVVGISAILGIVFGCVALGRIRWSRQGGRGLAIAGVVLGSAWLVLYLVLIAVGIVTGGSAPTSGSGVPATPGSAAPGSRTIDVFSLVTGDCFDNPSPAAGQQQSVTSVVQTPCNQPHNAQIFATFNVGGSLVDYPGEVKLRGIADSGCSARVKSSLDAAKVTSSMTIRFLFPLQDSWLGGRRTISCVVYNPTPALRSSLLKS